jgi:hypothetical protein
VEDLNPEADGRLDTFRYYLDCHIQIDDEVHGPMAERLIADLCGADAAKWEAAEMAASRALHARLEFWDGLSSLLC